MHGEKIVVEAKHDIPNLGYWSDGSEWVSWRLKFPGPGKYRVSASCGSVSDIFDFVVEADGQKLMGNAKSTGAWDEFKDVDLGEVSVGKGGEQTVSMRARDLASWKPLNLRHIKFTTE